MQFFAHPAGPACGQNTAALALGQQDREKHRENAQSTFTTKSADCIHKFSVLRRKTLCPPRISVTSESSVSSLLNKTLLVRPSFTIPPSCSCSCSESQPRCTASDSHPKHSLVVSPGRNCEAMPCTSLGRQPENPSCRLLQSCEATACVHRGLDKHNVEGRVEHEHRYAEHEHDCWDER